MYLIKMTDAESAGLPEGKDQKDSPLSTA